MFGGTNSAISGSSYCQQHWPSLSWESSRKSQLRFELCSSAATQISKMLGFMQRDQLLLIWQRLAYEGDVFFRRVCLCTGSQRWVRSSREALILYSIRQLMQSGCYAQTVDKHRHSVWSIFNRSLKGLFYARYTCFHLVRCRSQMIQLWSRGGPVVRQTRGNPESWQW